MTVDLNALKAAALAATPGWWSTSPKVRAAVYAGVLPSESAPVCLCDSMGELPRAMDARNAAHIAASCPAAVLELIDRLDRVEAELRQIYNEQAEQVGWKP